MCTALSAGVQYDSVLLNLYPDGASGMGWHQDPQSAEWAEDTAIVSPDWSIMVYRCTRTHSPHSPPWP
jgi:alkylated DNA repair dioxygenase AlkB